MKKIFCTLCVSPIFKIFNPNDCLGSRAAFLKPLFSKMFSFDMFFQEFRLPKGFLLSAPCFLCDSDARVT